MKPLDIHPEAVEEVSEALSFYGSHATDGVAHGLNDLINSALNVVANHPQRYPYWQKTRFRRCVLPRYPYVIFYEDKPDRVHVLAVAHTSRRPGYWKKRIAG